MNGHLVVDIWLENNGLVELNGKIADGIVFLKLWHIGKQHDVRHNYYLRGWKTTGRGLPLRGLRFGFLGARLATCSPTREK